MDRLGALDAEFLHLEDGISHMHIAGMSVFDGAPPSGAEVTSLLAAKLDRIPRYRQLVRSVPLELGRPVWIDDRDFDLAYHVRETALVEPTDAALCRLMSRLMSQELDRRRPLWEVWIVHGLPDGRWALVSKVHHCMVDGVAGVGLLEALLDIDPDIALPPPVTWEPRAEPSRPELVLDGWEGLATDVVGRIRSLPALALDPIGSVRRGTTEAIGLYHLVSRTSPTPERSIEGTIGSHRSWAHSSATLDDVSRIRSVFGGTVNDVVLTAVAGGFRDLLLAREGDVESAPLRTLVPVSVRHDTSDVLDNHVSAILYDLPIDVADPVVRLQRVRATMADLKASNMAEAGEVLTSAADLLPPMILGTASRLVMRISHDHPQRSLDTVTTNVPGPQFPLFCLGRRMLEHRPFVPITHGIRAATAILSYDGTLAFGITGDLRTVPQADVDTIASGIAATISELALRSTCGSGS